MRFDSDRVRLLVLERGMSLGEALRRSRVSRTAFYSLSGRPTALPGTVTALARTLGVAAPELLRESPSGEDRPHALLREARRLRARHPASDFQNLWHTLNLLELPPLERLNRSLTRGRARPVHR